MAWYAYCITEQQGLQGGIRARRPFVIENLRGVNDAPVFAYPSGEFAVIVSEYSPPPLNQEAIVVHARVVSECFRTMTVLPFRFGTIFDSDEALRRAVRTNRKAFLETVARLRGKAEMHFKILLKDGSAAASCERIAQWRWGRVSSQAARPGNARTGAADQGSRPLDAGTQAVFTAGRRCHLQAYRLRRDDHRFRSPHRLHSIAKYQNRYSAATRHFKDCKVSITGPWPPYHFMPGKLRTVPGGN